ncbi:MAG TPA: GNAT family N-acetyltransferase [Gemmataceae bacterium]|nr:GNAT family N-acetyltransferase [Gemmataceae bacterium]
MIRVRRMTAEDIPLGMRLKQQAGWNQTEADWRRFLDLEPEGCFVAEWNGVPAATTTTCTFGPVGWVAMVLVDADKRGRGLAKALLGHALEFLERRNVRNVRLDATALGRPLYERLGFTVEYELVRYDGTLPLVEASGPPEGNAESAESYDELCRLDARVTGTDRSRLLLRLFEENPDGLRVVRDGSEVAGFLTARLGSRAVQVGPCVATAGAGPRLLRDAWRRFAGQRVYMDIPTANTAATALAAAQGLTVQRPFLRMCRGPSVGERVDVFWASSGPEKG